MTNHRGSHVTSSRGSNRQIRSSGRNSSANIRKGSSDVNPFTALDDMAAVSFDHEVHDTEKTCGKCKDLIDDDEKALQCEFCATWFCLGCTEVPDRMYDLLQDKAIPSFLWTCNSCIHAIPTIKNLGNALRGVREDQVETKAEVTKLNIKVDKLEASIDTKVQDAIEAYRERENRKCNVIIHNIPESDKAESAVRKDDDVRELTQLFEDGLGVPYQDFEIKSTIRLGKKVDGKRRLIKVELGTVKTKKEIFG